MAERFESFLSSMPPELSAQMRGEFDTGLFMRIDRDGWYFTAPMEIAAEGVIYSTGGSTGNFEMTLRTNGSVGVMTAGEGDSIAFCVLPGDPPATLTTQSYSEGASNSATMPVFGDGPNGPMPMRQSCSGDRLRIYMDLPPPIGTVTYDLRRIAASDVPFDFDSLRDGGPVLPIEEGSTISADGLADALMDPAADVDVNLGEDDLRALLEQHAEAASEFEAELQARTPPAEPVDPTTPPGTAPAP